MGVVKCSMGTCGKIFIVAPAGQWEAEQGAMKVGWQPACLDAYPADERMLCPEHAEQKGDENVSKP